MNDRLYIITKIKRTIEYIDKSLDNFPHKYIELRNRVSNDLFLMLEYCYICNENIERSKYQSLCVVKLEMIDYCFKLSYKNKLISKKKYESISNHLLEIKKMIISWSNNEKNRKFI